MKFANGTQRSRALGGRYRVGARSVVVLIAGEGIDIENFSECGVTHALAALVTSYLQETS